MATTKKGKKLKKKEFKDSSEFANYVAKKAFTKGIPPRETLQISEEMYEYLYHFATQLYNSGKFQQGVSLFTMLITLDPSIAKCYTGLGCCQVKQKKYQDAIPSFIMAGELDKLDPVPFFYLADCLLNLDSKIEAAVALQAVIFRCGDNPIFDILKNKSILMLETLRPFLDQPTS